MAITRPVIFTSVEDLEVTNPRPVAEETVRKMVQDVNMLGALAVVGSIRFMDINLVGVVTPNPNIWQIADGGQITNPFSPITSITPNNYFTPEIVDNYVRGAADDSSNTFGGSSTIDASHTHNTTAVSHALVGEEGDERSGYLEPSHDHVIDPALTVPEPFDVSHQELAVYLKIG